jgi:hypothetical protein
MTWHFNPKSLFVTLLGAAVGAAVFAAGLVGVPGLDKALALAVWMAFVVLAVRSKIRHRQ